LTPFRPFKDSKNIQRNLLLTSSALENMGLKPLLAIKKYARGKRHIFQKKTKNKVKTGQIKKSPTWAQFEEIEFKYRQKLILAELKNLTTLLKKQERRVSNLERKLAL